MAETEQATMRLIGERYRVFFCLVLVPLSTKTVSEIGINCGPTTTKQARKRPNHMISSMTLKVAV